MKHLHLPLKPTKKNNFLIALLEIKKCLFILVIILGFTTVAHSQSIVTAVADGAWNDPATWDLAIVPSSLDSVVIPNGYSVTVTSTGETCSSIQVGAGDGSGEGYLYFTGTSSLTVSGNITLGAVGGIIGGLYTDDPTVLTSNAIIEGDPVSSSGDYGLDLGTVILTGTCGLSPNVNYMTNFVVNGGTISLAGNLNIYGDLTINSGATLDVTSHLIGRVDPGGTLTVSNGATLRIGVSSNLPTNFSTHSVGATSTIEYYGGAQQVNTLNSSQNYGNLILSGSSTKTTVSNIGIAGDLTINSGTFNLGIYSANRTSVGGTLKIANGAGLTMQGSGTLPTNFTTHNIGATSTITYSGTSAQNIAALNSSQKYGNLVISNSVKTMSGNFTVAGTITFGGTPNKLIIGSNTLTLEGNISGSLLGSRNFSGSSSSNMVVNGSGTRTLYFDTTTNGSTNMLNNFTVNQSGSLTLGDNLILNGTLTFTSGKLTIGSTTLTLKGNVVNTVSGGLKGSSTSNLVVNGAVSPTISFDGTTPGTTNLLSTLQINSSSQVVSLGSDLTVNGNTAITAGKLAINGNTLTLKADITNTAAQGIRGSATSKLIFNGSVSPTLSMDQTTVGTTNALSGLQINSSSKIITMDNNLQVNDSITFKAGKISINGNTLTLKGLVNNTVSQGIIAGSTSNLVMNGTASPTLSFDQTIPGTTNVINNFTINSSGQTVTLSNALRLLGTHTPTAGVLAAAGNYTIASTSGSTANIAAGSTSGGYITGNVIVERYIPQNTNRGWRLLASPTSGQTINQAWQEGQTGGANGFGGYGTIITSNLGSWSANGFDYLTPKPSMYSYDPSSDNLVPITSTYTAIASQPGYFIYIRGSRNINPDSSIIAGSATTLRTTGTLYTGNQSATTVQANQMALIGNPYPSALDLRSLSITGGCTGTAFYIWDPKLVGSYGLGAYQTLTPSGGNYLILPGGGSFGSAGSIVNTIQSGAAFFASAMGSSGTIGINESSKTSGSSMVFRPQGSTGSNLIVSLYAVNGSSTDLADGAGIFFDTNYSNQIDGNDNRKNWNFGENLDIANGDAELAVEKRTLPVTDDSIQLEMWTMKKMSYEFRISASNMQQSGMIVYLKDQYLNTLTPINLTDTTVYDFTINNSAGAINSNRFKLVFKPAIVLPVTFTSVKAYQQSDKIAVAWQVDNQINIKQYQVEKSINGKDFTVVGKVDAVNVNSLTASYEWLDQQPVQGINYYRVKSVENSGSFKYTSIVKVLIGNATPAITVFPNPVEGAEVNVQLISQPAGIYHIRLLNNAGQVLLATLLTHSGGSATNAVNIPSQLDKGIYQLEITKPDGSRNYQQLLINSKK